jgi:hypothetical protein
MKKCILFVYILAQVSLAQLITIDAVKDDFYNQLTGPDDGLIFLPSRCQLTEDNFTDPATDDDDLSALFWSAWDDEYFYYYVEVKDDFVTVSNATRWSNDCIEMKYDPDVTVDISTGTLQTTMSALDLDAPGTTAPDGVDNINTDAALVDTGGVAWEPVNWVDIARDYENISVPTGTYAVEWRVPLAYVNRPATEQFLDPAVGNIFGAAINVADNDGIERTAMLQWSAGHADAVWNDPALMGKVTFLENNKLKWEAVSARTDSVNANAADWYTPEFTNSLSDNDFIPGSFQLNQNYPNPFNPETVISYTVDKNENVSLTVYNVMGEVVASLIENSFHNAGTHSVKWNGRNNNGGLVSSGVYLYRLTQGSNVSTKKMMLVR